MIDPDGAGAPVALTGAGPLRKVVAALEAGAFTRAELARRCDLDREVVDAALDHLSRTGLVTQRRLASGCPEHGCASCPSGRADGAAGCGAAEPARSRGPIALTLATRRPG